VRKRFRALGDSLAVSRTAQFVLHHGVDGDEFNAVWDGHELMRQFAAVEQNGMLRDAEDGGVLVHDAARHADEITFGTLAEFGDFELFERASGQKRISRSHFERRRGAETASEAISRATPMT
jgi:hypothetical protein